MTRNPEKKNAHDLKTRDTLTWIKNDIWIK